jgi:peptidoglycan/LPS O-acetylase OafA/YrhL
MTAGAARDYRPDVDGLRAVAVLPVVLFHAGVGGFPGGYVGVDVFFVISGYLITRILLRELECGDYSVLRFYARRVRRIFPALFALLAAVTAAGWFLLLPREYNDLGNALAAATFFYSNYHFMGETGYFAAPAETQPLLHTWSLAVEEQFYIVFPFLLWALARAARARHCPGRRRRRWRRRARVPGHEPPRAPPCDHARAVVRTRARRARATLVRVTASQGLTA